MHSQLIALLYSPFHLDNEEKYHPNRTQQDSKERKQSQSTIFCSAEDLKSDTRRSKYSSINIASSKGLTVRPSLIHYITIDDKLWEVDHLFLLLLSPFLCFALVPGSNGSSRHQHCTAVCILLPTDFVHICLVLLHLLLWCNDYWGQLEAIGFHPS